MANGPVRGKSWVGPNGLEKAFWSARSTELPFEGFSWHSFAFQRAFVAQKCLSNAVRSTRSTGLPFEGFSWHSFAFQRALVEGSA